jgi:Nif-specific regulatory protein
MEEISYKRKDYRLLDEVISVTKTCIDIKRALYRIAEIIGRILNIQKVVILVKDERNEQLTVFASFGLLEGSEYQVTKQEIAMHILKGKPFIFANVMYDLVKSRKAKNVQNAKSILGVPITFQNNPMGALCVEKKYVELEDLDKIQELLLVVGSIVSQRFRSYYNLQTVKKKFELEKSLLKKELDNSYLFGRIIGKSKGILSVFDQINNVSQTDTTVLIRGESGTGKELIAHAIHYNSHRANEPFVKVNCSAFPESLIESELFGHEKGAFTDAHDRRIGRFELANKGTLFLDEIGELSPQIQVKLLRVVQEKQVERLGGSKIVSTDVRIIAATNSDLEKAVAEKSFREDFYYRISVFPIFVPPLRERKSDILLLAHHFAEKYSKEASREIPRFSSQAIQMLNNYSWPGNIRELENCIQRAVILCKNNVVRPQNLSFILDGNPVDLMQVEQKEIKLLDYDEGSSLEETINGFEKRIIINALTVTKGNKLKAAELLKTTNRIVGYKIEKHGIEVELYKNDK